MSSLTTLARPYAKAAFELARSEGALADWNGMLNLAGEIAAEDSMSALLESPHVTADQRLDIIVEAGGKQFDRRFRNFLSVLSENGRLALLPHICVQYRQLRQQAENRLHVRVVSAIPLEEGQKERMRVALARRFDSDIELENDIDAGVLGGAVVYAGDQVIDGSLRGRLARLQNNLSS
jgi:F-type H+-transporting ATPase subunit delta